MTGFLPITKAEMKDRGWHYVDFVCVTGDSYVDHPSFGIAIISRILESMGFKVGIVSQPQKDEDYSEFGPPRYGFMITSGNIDSMVNHYTAAKRKRSDDYYTAGGKAGKRPDRALLVYSKAIRKLFPEAPIVLGGLEASFRRFAHYDYWEDSVRPSVLAESGADIISFGMGELQTREIAARLLAGEKVSSLIDVRGTCYMDNGLTLPKNTVSCSSFEKVASDKGLFSKSFKIQIEEQDYMYGKGIVQKHGDKYLVQNPPARPLTTKELDELFELPFMRAYHPSYEAVGGVPAIEEVQFSIMHNRGCFGGCNFCSITFHQGRTVSARSKESIIAEARRMTDMPNFKGYIHDVGGPTANFRAPSCAKQLEHGVCKHRKCLAPKPCANIEADHSEYLDILRELRTLPKVKKVFVRSGLRYDYMNLDNDKTFLRELVEYHVSGQLKVAPEHCSDTVLNYMGKPSIEAFDKFAKEFYATTKSIGKEQYLVPYLMSSHPGATIKDAVELAVYLKKNNLRPEQVQDFYPTPGTASTSMFYTETDPFTSQKVYVAKTPEDKAMQRALLQYFNPKNKVMVTKALRKAGREDLIGSGVDCLVAGDSSEQKVTEKKSEFNKGFKNKGNKNSKNYSSKHTKNKRRK